MEMEPKAQGRWVSEASPTLEMGAEETVVEIDVMSPR